LNTDAFVAIVVIAALMALLETVRRPTNKERARSLHFRHWLINLLVGKNCAVVINCKITGQLVLDKDKDAIIDCDITPFEGHDPVAKTPAPIRGRGQGS
jgi:hypothetical protein